MNEENHIVGVGYNGFPNGCSDDALPWERTGPVLETKYPYVVHAELNAILNSNGQTKGCRIYVDLFPCNDCAKAIIQSGIKEVIYLSDKYKESEAVKASKTLLAMANVSFRQLQTATESLTLKFK